MAGRGPFRIRAGTARPPWADSGPPTAQTRALAQARARLRRSIRAAQIRRESAASGANVSEAW
ncbi:hypothetical protein Pph01_62890 [Planotetraspora phitsanulokensis]|uniref:Uncharacterized protein n=1 Tax=Planotetraspora phitsanulokensis TaxID=575192 RepID=A0A8J3XIT9_9ACTN|nr:hypothetical protein Pph01_62890 [Planotetraspora phitsanulokensis]